VSFFGIATLKQKLLRIGIALCQVRSQTRVQLLLKLHRLQNPDMRNPVAHYGQYFVGLGHSGWAGQRAAAVMSLIQSAKLNGHDSYLKDVMDKLPTWPNRRIDELLPHRWQSVHNAANSVA
jgi:transposase